MRTLGNILWFFIMGWWQGIICALCGVVFCLTIIGIPIGKAMFQYAYLIMLPFGKQIVRETFINENVSTVRRVGGIIANVLWFPFGLIGMIFTLTEMLACFITIIFIPAGIVLAKSCYFMLFPIGAKVIDRAEYQAILNAKEMQRRNIYNSPNNGYQYNQQSSQGYQSNANIQNGYGGEQRNPNVYQQNPNSYTLGNTYGTNNMSATSGAPVMQNMATSFCVACGSKIYAGHKFCEKCGRKVRNPK